MALEPLTGLRVVDLYAGSGALGIEALSRGASHADFVERRGSAVAVLRGNLTRLGLDDLATVWTLDLTLGLKPLRAALGAAHLVLLDPPYRLGLATAAVERLGAGWLRSGARVVAEHHTRDELPERAGTLVQSRSRRYGETAVTTYLNEAPS